MLATYYSAPFLLHCYTASDGIKQFADILEQRSQPDKICITFFFGWLVLVWDFLFIPLFSIPDVLCFHHLDIWAEARGVH